MFDALHRGEARFSDARDLEVVGFGGKVVRSAVYGVAAAGGRGFDGPQGGASPEARRRGTNKMNTKVRK